MKQRNQIIDILRAMGIILVVIGHCINISFFNRFIYLFHLPLFFFISGYLYKEENSKDPWRFIGTIIKKYLKPLLIFNTIFLISHNLFFKMGILQNSYLYNINDFVMSFLNSFLFVSSEIFSCAMWFLPVLSICLIIFNFVTYLSRKGEIVNEIKRGIVILFLTIIGIYLNKNNLNFGLHYQTSLAVLPFIYIAQLIKKYNYKIKKSSYIAITITIITLISIHYIPGQVELSINQLWRPSIFYPLSIGMIYSTYIISLIIEKFCKKITSFLIYIGKKSLSIMGLHIMCFKVFDFVMIHLISKNYDILDNFTVSYPNYWIIYTIVGVLMPIILEEIFKKIRIKIKKYYSENSLYEVLEKLLITV